MFGSFTYNNVNKQIDKYSSMLAIILNKKEVYHKLTDEEKTKYSSMLGG